MVLWNVCVVMWNGNIILYIICMSSNVLLLMKYSPFERKKNINESNISQ